MRECVERVCYCVVWVSENRTIVEWQIKNTVRHNPCPYYSRQFLTFWAAILFTRSRSQQPLSSRRDHRNAIHTQNTLLSYMRILKDDHHWTQIKHAWMPNIHCSRINSDFSRCWGECGIRDSVGRRVCVSSFLCLGFACKHIVRAYNTMEHACISSIQPIRVRKAQNM